MPVEAASQMALDGAMLPVQEPEAKKHTASVSKKADLTHREQDVLKLLAFGKTDQQIATELTLSARTVQSHLLSIYRKLGVSSRGAAIRFATDNDLV